MREIFPLILLGVAGVFLFSRRSEAAYIPQQSFAPFSPSFDYGGAQWQNPNITAGDLAAYAYEQQQQYVTPDSLGTDETVPYDESNFDESYSLDRDNSGAVYDGEIIEQARDMTTENNSEIVNVATGQNLQTSFAGIQKIASHEGVGSGSVAGVYHVPYTDAVGKPTIGYGHLIRPGENFTRITESEAQAILGEDIRIAEAEVLRKVRAPLTQNQFDALVSLAFNVGSLGAGIVDLLNSGNYTEAANRILAYNKGTMPNGALVEVPGLNSRRQAERRLFLSTITV